MRLRHGVGLFDRHRMSPQVGVHCGMVPDILEVSTRGSYDVELTEHQSDGCR